MAHRVEASQHGVALVGAPHPDLPEELLQPGRQLWVVVRKVDGPVLPAHPDECQACKACGCSAL